MDIEALYPLVTEAIRRAEALEDLGAPGTRIAQMDVSKLEEEIAKLLPASDPEGALARRGAVRAALAARDFSRARQLAAHYQAEKDTDRQLSSALAGMLEEASRKVGLGRFAAAVKRFGDEAIRDLARVRIQQGAPLPIH